MDTISHSQNNGQGPIDLGNHQRDFSRVNVNVSPLEQEVLDEYARLARNMERLSSTLTLLTTSTTTTTSSPQSPSPTTTATGTTSPPPAHATTTTPPAPQLPLEITESLRHLERKVASVYTLMKASVYSIVLQQGEGEGETDHDDSVVGGDRDERGGVAW